MELPSDFPSRASLFTHIEDRIDCPQHDRDKILITIHPQHRDVWFWLIPFGQGRSSVGVVAPSEFFDHYPADKLSRLQQIIAEVDELQSLLSHAQFDTPVQSIEGYACNVKSLWGNNYALLGNAGEFLDPVFSSGVTIAMKSASLITPLVDRQLAGKTVNWESEYAQPLRQGVDTFRAYVNAWYDGRFQDIIFTEQQSDTIREMISSILAGYAWDQNNPFVAEPEKRLNTLFELCRI